VIGLNLPVNSTQESQGDVQEAPPEDAAGTGLVKISVGTEEEKVIHVWHAASTSRQFQSLLSMNSGEQRLILASTTLRDRVGEDSMWALDVVFSIAVWQIFAAYPNSPHQDPFLAAGAPPETGVLQGKGKGRKTSGGAGMSNGVED
jgi:hypothetical protein